MTLKSFARIGLAKALVLAAASLAALALQAVSTSYINASGQPDTADCTVITSSSTALSTGWYVVEAGTVNISSYVTVNGDVNLILADDAKLTVSSPTMDKAGICVEVVDSVTNSLSIYCQAAGTGELHADSSSYGPGIGTAGEDHTCGIVTIYGGNVYATGSQYGSGIGSGWKGAGGTVTINGGTVTAIGGSSAGAGIGGGYQGTGGTVIINGGTVTAKVGNSSYAGIGGQSGKDQGALTVGGNVVVMAGNSESLTDSDIQNPNGETSISLATIYQYYQVDTTGPKPLSQVTSALAAYAGELFNISLASTISGGSGSYTFSGTVPDGVTLNDGVLTGTLAAGVYNFTLSVTDSEDAELTPPASYTLTVSARPKSITYKDGTTTINGLEPSEYTPGTPVNLASYVKPGYTFLGWYDNDGLTGDAVTAVSAAETEDLTFWARCSLDTYTIQYYDGSTLLTGLAPTSYTITQTPVSLPTPEGEDGVTFAGWCTTSSCTDSPITSIAANSTGDKIFYAKWTSNSPGDPSADGFIDDDPVESSKSWAVTVECQTAYGVFQRKCEEIDEWTYTLKDCWYYVGGEVTLDSLTIEGRVSLILGDGARLVVGSEYGGPGILLTDGNTLTIYGQSEGTGELVATGASNCAGIGGGMMNEELLCGKLNVYGGNITAIGGDWAPGIGSTDMENDSTTQVFIYGGNVTATGSDYFGGIGGSIWHGQGTLTVGDNMAVKAGADADSAEELTPGVGGAVTLSAQKYFHIESTGSVPLAQGRSELAATVGDVIALSSTIVGGKKPYTFTGSVPSGLTLSGGTLTCTTAGEYNFSLTVTDAESTVIQATYALTVETLEKTITYIDGNDGVTVLTGLTPTQYIPGGSTIYLPNASDVTKPGYIFNGWYLTPELTGSAVVAIFSSDKGDKTFYAKFTLQTYSISYRDHNDNYYSNLAPGSYTITNTPVALPTPEPRDGFTFDGWCENQDRSDPPTMTLPLNSTGYRTFYAKWTENEPEEPEDPEPGETGEEDVDYIDENGDPQTAYCVAITADTTTLTNGGWYAVTADVEVSGTIAVEGSAYLVLVDDKTLTVQGADFYPGIAVTEGNSLTIYGQVGNTGTLNATGGNNGAGIGGGASSAISVDHSAGAITINGGTVIANGGTYSAGIGGGNGGNGGDVTVNGGSVIAESGWPNTPGIGGGYIYTGTDDGTLTVSGKMVVMAGETSFETSEKNPGTVTRTIEIDKSWGYFLIEEEPAPVLTYWAIRYHDTSGYLIDGLEPTNYVEGVGVSLATAVPTKTGYTFAYWYADDENVPVTEIPASATGDIDLHVKWTSVEFTIEYYLKGKKIELSPSTYTLDGVTVLPEEVNGYYIQWRDNPELEGDWVYLVGAGTKYARNLTLYADADPIPYTITFYDGETGDQIIEVYLYMIGYNADYETFDLPRTAHKDWRRFVNWYDNRACEGDPVISIPSGSFSNKQFYAKWETTTDPVLTVDTNGNLVAASLNGHTEIEIPNTVRRVSDFVFFNFTTLEAVTIPSTVTNIDEFAFCNCSSLKQLELPEGLRTIGWCAFESCSSLEYVYIPKGVTVGDSAFFLCESLKSVNIGGTVVQSQGKRTTLKRGLLAASPLLGAEPEDPEAIQVGKMAFSCCGNLESARVGAKVADIGGGAFSGCAKLNEIIVEEGNENFKSESGMLLNKTGTTLISGTGAGALVGVPSGVTSIADGAFAGSDTLQRVTLPDSVTSVGEAAFSNCTALAVATIPSSVASIGAGSFCDTALATVYVTAGSVDATRARIYGTGYDTLGVQFIEMATPGAGVPSVKDDSAATVIGNASNGYTVLPSAMEGAVEVTIPDGLAADKVTVEVPATASVKPNGATVKVVNGANDITEFLDIPAADAGGVVDLNAATVKEAIVKEVLDPTNDDVDIDLDPSDPSITTAATRPGLTYTFSEGTTLEGMTQKSTKTGDGTSWTPTITVKGGTSGFYSIGVTK